MTSAVLGAVLALLSVWDYPARQFRHEMLRRDFADASSKNDVSRMTEAARGGVKLLPDDPVWHYNLACALARSPVTKARDQEIFAEIEKAVDLGFRDVGVFANDRDFKRLRKLAKFDELKEYMEARSSRPMMTGPNAHVAQVGNFGETITFGEQNLIWNLDKGLFEVDMKLAGDAGTGNLGDLYMNRDGGHSSLEVKAWPGLTVVQLDRDGKSRRMDLDEPNMLFPYPLFGNASRAFLDPVYWRSIPRMLMTRDAWRMGAMMNLYLSNQFWVFPAHRDFGPAGKFGDVFLSISPYFLVTSGSSYSDRPYLAAGLEASRSLKREVKEELVRKGLLAPTLMTLVRKSLKAVADETDYLTVAAHPTAFAPDAVDLVRLRQSAASLEPATIPPLAPLTIGVIPPVDRPTWPEATYLTPYSSAFVLRSADTNRSFMVRSSGAAGYEFSLLRDGAGAARLIRKSPDTVVVEIDRSRMTASNRVDLAVFARSVTSGWGAPSYVSFAVIDPSAEYSDPALVPPSAVTEEPKR